MVDETVDIKSLQKKLAGLLETLKQVNYQNSMMLNWVNGAVITVDHEGLVIQAKGLRSIFHHQEGWPGLGTGTGYLSNPDP